MTALTLVMIAGGSATGAVFRQALGDLAAKYNPTTFPISTWIANTLGTLLFGVFAKAQLSESGLQHPWLLLGLSFCGAFTTFSTLSVEATTLFRKSAVLGTTYLVSSFATGVLLVWFI